EEWYSDEEIDEDSPTRNDSLRGPNIPPVQIQKRNARLNARSNEQTKNRRQNLEGNKAKKQGIMIRFYRNGDVHFRGIEQVINKQIKDFNALLNILTTKMEMPSGVRFVFGLDDGKRITKLEQFQAGREYVASGVKQLKRLDYGNVRSTWSNRRLSAGKVRKSELNLFGGTTLSQVKRSRESSNTPKIVPIINLANDSERVMRIILNPQTAKPFEEWLKDISSDSPEITCLFTQKPPHTKVESYSQLFHELDANKAAFYAAPNENVLLNLLNKNKREMPRMSSNDAIADRGIKKRPQRQPDLERRQIDESSNGFETPVSVPYAYRYEGSSRYDSGPSGLSSYGAVPNFQYKVPYGKAYSAPNETAQVEVAGRIREFFPPTETDPDDDGHRPDKILRIEWVYGYRGRDRKFNLTVLPKTCEVVYYVASVVVLYDKDQDSQRHYLEHNEEITCMALHPSNYIIASGQLQGKTPENAAHIRIWDAYSLDTYKVIGVGFFIGGITSISFSVMSSGNFMCVLDQSGKNILSVWDWQAEKLVARTTNNDSVLCACFYPDDDTIIMTYGKQHLFFWKIFYDPIKHKEGRILRDRNSGIFEEDIPKYFNCHAFTPGGDVITGDNKGNLMVWVRDDMDAIKCRLKKSAHKGPVIALCMLEDGTLVSGSGSEIKAWDTSASLQDSRSRQIPEVAGNIQAIVPLTLSGTDFKLFVGTTNGCIFEGSLKYKMRYMVQSSGENVTSLVAHPRDMSFITAGLDQSVTKWSMSKHDVVWRTQVESPCTCISLDMRNNIVAVGTVDGKFIILKSSNGKIVASKQASAEQIHSIAYSSGMCKIVQPAIVVTYGCLLALGFQGGLIEIYSVIDEGTRFRSFNTSLTGHVGSVKQIDWSSDGWFLQTTGDDFELCFWDVRSMQPIKVPRTMRDIDWFTHNCTLVYNTLGAWTGLENGEIIKTVCRSNFRDLMVTGDDEGILRLYKYPSSRLRADCRSAKMYSAEVKATAFSCDDTIVISCGGNDTSIIQWSVVDAMSGM
ncbi:hypothetical protein ACJMK2_007210, partial [Sinanodonta woodiana]